MGEKERAGDTGQDPKGGEERGGEIEGEEGGGKGEKEGEFAGGGKVRVLLKEREESPEQIWEGDCEGLGEGGGEVRRRGEEGGGVLLLLLLLLLLGTLLGELVLLAEGMGFERYCGC